MKQLLCLIIIAVFLAACSNQNKSIQEVQPSEGFVQVKSMKLWYQSLGFGKETVVFVHAGFMDHQMWNTQVAALKDNYRIVLLDLPGHGRSGKNDTTVFIADALATVLDSLNIEQAHFMGLSLGAVAVTDFAIAYPQKVKKLVLAGPGVAGWEKEHALDTATKQYFPALMGALQKGDTAGAAEVFTHYWGDGPYRRAGDWDTTTRGYIYRTTLATMYKNKISGWPRFAANPPAIANIHKITAPTLIIAGDKDMPYILEASDFLQKTIKGARKVIIPNTAHMLNMEAPEAFNKAVLNFLEE